jgi:hypothetical protein
MDELQLKLIEAETELSNRDKAIEELKQQLREASSANARRKERGKSCQSVDKVLSVTHVSKIKGGLAEKENMVNLGEEHIYRDRYRDILSLFSLKEQKNTHEGLLSLLQE